MKTAIPKKISPDNLVDAIIQIRYRPNCHDTFVQAVFNDIFHQELTFKSETIEKIGGNQQSFNGKLKINYFITSDKMIKVNVDENSITFNMLHEYCGWDNYEKIIKNIVK